MNVLPLCYKEQKKSNKIIIMKYIHGTSLVPRVPHGTSENRSGTVVQILGPRVKCLFPLNN